MLLPPDLSSTISYQIRSQSAEILRDDTRPGLHSRTVQPRHSGTNRATDVHLCSFCFVFLAESSVGSKTPHPDLPNVQQAAVMLRSNPSILQLRAFNKQRKQRITLSFPKKKRKKVALEREKEEKKNCSYLTNAGLFEVRTRKNEGTPPAPTPPVLRAPYDSNLEVLCILARACGL